MPILPTPSIGSTCWPMMDSGAGFWSTPSLIRIEAPIFSSNKGSEKVLEKNGFQFEGNLIKAYFKEGKYIDAKMYALIKD